MGLSSTQDGAVLALSTTGFSVYRSIVFSIVLTLAAGPNAAALCAGWCETAEIAARACRHDAPAASASVSGADPCGGQKAPLSTVGVDTRRMATAPSFIGVAAGKAFAHSPAGTDRAALSSHASPFHSARHLITLRI